MILAVDLGSDDNLALARGLADALEVEAEIGRDGDFEGGSGGGSPVDRFHFRGLVFGLVCSLTGDGERIAHCGGERKNFFALCANFFREGGRE